MVDKVVTVAGTGKQGNDYEGGEFGTDQVVSSPWDVVVRIFYKFNSKNLN